jgi:hypothetical protein
MSRQRCVNRTKVDGRTNVICALFGSWTVEKQQCLRKNILYIICLAFIYHGFAGTTS